LSGSSDLYQTTGKRPYASINFITSHDGFTLNDLVSYNHKHNEANGENNRDGDNNNNSWNCGVEGPTDDESVKRLRARQRRNFLATLFLSQGVPMVCAGDELCRTQHGNNNAYCQDNECSWLHHDLDAEATQFLEFARNTITRSVPADLASVFYSYAGCGGRPTQLHLSRTAESMRGIKHDKQSFSRDRFRVRFRTDAGAGIRGSSPIAGSDAEGTA